MNRLEVPEQGEIILGGKTIDLSRKNSKEIVELRKSSGMVFQRFNLLKR